MKFVILTAFFGLPAFVALGYFSVRNRFASMIVKILFVGLLIVTVSAVLTGVATAKSHGVLSTLLIPATLVIVPLVTGYIIRGQSRIGAALQCVVGVGHILTTIVTAFTGTLPASAIAGQETMNRFVVLHMFALPTLLAFFLGQSCWKVIASRRMPFVERQELEPAATGSSNPYDAPRT